LTTLESLLMQIGLLRQQTGDFGTGWRSRLEQSQVDTLVRLHDELIAGSPAPVCRSMFALACVTQDQNGTSVEVFIGPTEDEVWLRASRDLFALIQQRNETGDRGAMQDAEAAFHTMNAKEFVEMWNGNSTINSLPNEGELIRYVPAPIYLADQDSLPAWDGQFVTARIQVSEALTTDEVRAFLEAMPTVCAEDCPAGWEVFSVTTGVA
jgi:hypothetical protein